MYRRLLYILLLFLSLTTVKAQNLAFYFELIPEEQLPHLKPDMRKGMVGLYELGERPARVPNLLNGDCILDTLSNDYLSMHTSTVSTLDIKMLESQIDSTEILVVLHTVKAASTEDSSIEFFSKTWSPMDASRRFSAPSVNDFYQQNDKVSIEEFTSYCIPLLISYKIDGETLYAAIDPEKYLPKEVYEKISPAFTGKQVRYIWIKERGEFIKE